MKNGNSKIEIRPFAWHDLWKLYRYRHQVQYLDNALAVTRGTSLGFSSLFGSLNPNHIVETLVMRSRSDGSLLVGQVQSRNGDHSARLSFLLPERELTSPAAPALIESLAWEAGDRGALHLLAEVEERSHAVEALRRAGFSIYGWQRIWRFTAEEMPNRGAESCWQAASSQDEIAIRSLYHTVAPPLVQAAEPLNGRALVGLVHRQDGEVMAYASGQGGPGGIYLNPVVHPNVTALPAVMSSLVCSLTPRAARPIFIAVRSYQSWLEAALGELGGEPGPRQTLMIKHMVQMQRAAVPAAARPVTVDSRQPALAGQPSEAVRAHSQFEDFPPAAGPESAKP